MQATLRGCGGGGGKRAFRAAAQKAKEKRSRSVRNTKGHHMFTVILTAEKEPDGTITVKPEISGQASAEVKARFDSFCEEVKSLLIGKGATAN